MNTILIIEDEKSLCEAIKFKFEEKGFKAICVSLAKEGLEILKKNGVDLIWLDLKLPKMHGLDFLKLIKNDPQLKDKKVIIVSVSGEIETKEEAEKLGALDYIVKSELNLNDIIARVINYV